MISLTSLYYDLNGAIQFPRLAEGSDLDSGARRATRYATLDGGAAVHDGGHSVGDESMSILIEPATSDQVETVRHLGESYPQIRVCTKRGSFTAILSSWVARDGALAFDIELLERTSV